jgi:hypothetical protein
MRTEEMTVKGEQLRLFEDDERIESESTRRWSETR